MNLLIDREIVQSFNTFLPGLAIVTDNFKGQFLVIVLYLYPESPTKIKYSAFLPGKLNFFDLINL